ncbi:4Fe-4S binding protein [Pseudofulvibacter geojedonensis]|uniref:4Fe-4S binding protein n=1 Tax=Pseudofulvibacter geojedonensis TaxID=1123758 RepID=A0ABW3I172_9FLAO
MESKNTSYAISNPHKIKLDPVQKISFGMALIGVLVLAISFLGINIENKSISLTFSLLSIIVGTSVYAYRTYSLHPKGIKNNHVWFNSLSNRGIWGWILGFILTGFYILLYWFPEILGQATGPSGINQGLIALFDPLSHFFISKPANQWFVYGTLYTVLIFALGIKFIYKYRYNRYQVIRTIVVIASQTFFAYLIPQILEGLNYNGATNAEGKYIGWYDTDLKNVWPLDYDFFNKWHLDAMQAEAYQPLGMTYLVWGVILFLVVTPFLSYFLGKRWYCSWICGCGGLAETAGDSFRHLSSKKLSAWKLERWLIHLIMVWVFIMTAATLYGYFTKSGTVFGLSIYKYFQQPYGFIIGAAFSGVIGVGFYPILGSRVWCRFGCPMAGYMGLFQRFKSRFRITTNGGQCISCGNCSTYCEQGIDVRAYAQKGQNIVRASCVGCGICSAVCPRGVLKLENAPNDDKTRYIEPDVILGNDVDLMNLLK